MSKNRFDPFDHRAASLAMSKRPSHAATTSVDANPSKSSKLRIGRDAYDTLVGMLATVPESPTTPLGVFVANSTKRDLLMRINEKYEP